MRKRTIGQVILGGQGPNSFDCIGLAKFCLDIIGKGGKIGKIYHYQYDKGRHVDKKTYNLVMLSFSIFLEFHQDM